MRICIRVYVLAIVFVCLRFLHSYPLPQNTNLLNPDSNSLVSKKGAGHKSQHRRALVILTPSQRTPHSQKQFLEIRVPFLGCPYNDGPTILGAVFASLNYGNSHIESVDFDSSSSVFGACVPDNRF